MNDLQKNSDGGSKDSSADLVSKKKRYKTLGGYDGDTLRNDPLRFTRAMDEPGVCNFKTKEKYQYGAAPYYWYLDSDKVYVNNHDDPRYPGGMCLKPATGHTNFDSTDWETCGKQGWDDKIKYAVVPCGKKLFVKDNGTKSAVVHGPYIGDTYGYKNGTDFPKKDSIDQILGDDDETNHWVTARSHVMDNVLVPNTDNKEYCDLHINTSECIDFCQKNPADLKCKEWIQGYCYKNRNKSTALCDEAFTATRDSGLAKYCFDTGNPQSGDAKCVSSFESMPSGTAKTEMLQNALKFCKAQTSIVGNVFCENVCKMDEGHACDAEIDRECLNGTKDAKGFCSCYLPREEIPNFRPDKNSIAVFGTPCLYDKCQTRGYKNKDHKYMLDNVCPDCINNNTIEYSTVSDTSQSNTCLNQNNSTNKDNPNPNPNTNTNTTQVVITNPKKKNWFESLSKKEKIGLVVSGIVVSLLVIGLILYFAFSKDKSKVESESLTNPVVSSAPV